MRETEANFTSVIRRPGYRSPMRNRGPLFWILIAILAFIVFAFVAQRLISPA